MKAVNNAVAGTIALNDYTVALSGSSEDVAAALSGTFASTYTGTAAVSDVHSLAQLKTINNGTTGTITLTDYTVALSGSSADVAAALDGTFAAAYTGAATVSDPHTLDQLKTCLLYTSPSPRDREKSRMPSSA